MDDIQALKNKLFNKYGIVLQEDDPAWLMILIYKDLMSEINNAINDLENIPKITTRNEEILTALTTLQTKTNELFDKSKEITGKIETENNAFLSGIDEKIEAIKGTVNDAINDAINSVEIDVSAIKNIFEDKLKSIDLSESIGILKKTVTIINSDSKTINDAVNNLTKKTDNINNAVGDINRANKSLSMAMTLSMLFVGIVIGAGAMTYFKIDAMSDYFFSHYDKKQAKLENKQKEIEEKIEYLGEFEQWLLVNKYKIYFGHFNNHKQDYISIDKSTHKKCKGWNDYYHDTLQDHAYLATSKNLVICF